jgi:hypothetical protein
LDTEWKISYRKERKRVDTIQIAYIVQGKERLLVLQLKCKVLPISLVSLLTSRKVQWIRNYVKGDINRINEILFPDGEKMSLENAWNLNSTPIVKTDIGTSRINLQALCKHYLGYDLPKESRFSDWSGKLTELQIDYAWCGLLLYYTFTKKMENLTGMNCLPLSAGSEEPDNKIANFQDSFGSITCHDASD